MKKSSINKKTYVSPSCLAFQVTATRVIALSYTENPTGSTSSFNDVEEE